jgi:hypothetical protein
MASYRLVGRTLEGYMTKRQYTKLCRKPLSDLSDEELSAVVQYEFEQSDLEDLRDSTSEFDRRFSTNLRSAVAAVNNEIMHLGEAIRSAIA